MRAPLPARLPIARTAALTLIALWLVGVVLVPSAASAPALPAANSQTYQDSTGENPNAPDITTVVVSNDDAGTISFRVNVPNRPTFTRDILVGLFVDTDNNEATGDPESLGGDYVIQLFEGEATLFRWDGSDFTRRPGDPASTSLLFSYQDGATITISAAELGNTKLFGFAAFVVTGIAFDPETNDPDFTSAVSDAAPAAGSGLYRYEVKIARPSLVVRKIATTPAKKAVAGKTLTMRMTVARSDTGAVLQNGRVKCVGRVGTKTVRAQLARVQSGAVTCAWLIPAATKGKTFRGQATVVFEGLKATGSVTRKIG